MVLGGTHCPFRADGESRAEALGMVFNDAQRGLFDAPVFMKRRSISVGEGFKSPLAMDTEGRWRMAVQKCHSPDVLKSASPLATGKLPR